MRLKILTFLLAAGLTTAANADPIEWTFNDVIFIGDNGSITGSFVYDADTNSVTEFNISASAGGLILCEPATLPDTGCASFPESGSLSDATFSGFVGPFVAPDGNTGIRLFGDGQNTQLVFRIATDMLTNAGGTFDVLFGAQWQCPTDAFCERNILSTPFRTAFVGTISAVGVPEPGTLALLGLGLAGFGLRKRSS